MIIKQTPPLAGAEAAARAVPDFRNLGVVLRILLLVNGLAVVAVLLRNQVLSQLVGELLDMAMRVEFPLILSVAVLFLIQPGLARLPGLAARRAGNAARRALSGRLRFPTPVLSGSGSKGNSHPRRFHAIRKLVRMVHKRRRTPSDAVKVR